MQAFHYLMFTFTFMHLAEAFIQSDILKKKKKKWTVLNRTVPYHAVEKRHYSAFRL